MKNVLNYFRKNKIIGFIIISGIAVGALTFGVIHVSSNDNAEIRHKGAIERPGYEPVPETYVIEASPSKKWAETGKILVVLGFLVALASGLAIVREEYHPETEKSNNTELIILAMWFIAVCLTFGGYTAKHGDSSYTTELCADEYEIQKDNLDALFPDTDEPLNCN